MQSLNKHQAELIKQVSITPDQIFEHMDDLNEEIAESWDQEEAAELMKNDPTFESSESDKEVTMEEVDIEEQLAKEAAAAEAILKKAQEEQKAKLEEQAEEVEQEDLSPAEQQRLAILDLLSRVKGAPDARGIAALKAKHGENGVKVLALGEDDVYMFTYLKRGQWQHIQKVIQAAASSDLNANPDEMLKEKVIQYTVLWPKGVSSPEFLFNSRAGVIDTLYQTILLNSYFLSPQQAMMLTTQL